MIRIRTGDVREHLAELPAQSVQCCVTSPPYYGLRDYGVAGQIGLEPTLAEYIVTMVDVFRGVRRVLADDGTLWLNIGDSYAGGGRGGHGDGLNGTPPQGIGNAYPKSTLSGMKPKDLMMVPARLAIALQEPYVEPCCVPSEIHRAWLAAMFDGEGCIGIRRFSSYRKEVEQVYQDGFVVYTSMTNNDVPLIDRCIELTGKGKATVKQRANKTDDRGIVSRFDSHGWRLDGNSAVDVIRAIYPYLIAKRKQAVLAYTLDRLNKRSKETRGNGPVPPEEQAKRVLLYDLIKRANQREEIDVPSWCEEPTQEVTPGWYLRSDIIWAKPNPMPESVRDRPTSSHEHIFLLTKQARYFYDADAVREPLEVRKPGLVDPGNDVNKRAEQIKHDQARGSGGHFDGHKWNMNELGRNLRNVWTITTHGFPEAHFATFPTEIPRRCIKAGSREGDTILDPFLGSGTTLLVADELGRNGIGIELNPEYAAMAERRITGACPMFAEVGVA